MKFSVLNYALLHKEVGDLSTRRR